VVNATGAVWGAGAAPAVESAAGEGADAVVAATARFRLADPAACAAVTPAGPQPLPSAGVITAPSALTGRPAAGTTGAGAGVVTAAAGVAGSVAVAVLVVVRVVVPSALAVVTVAVVVAVVADWGVVLPVAALVVPVVVSGACEDSVVAVVVVVVVVVDDVVTTSALVELVPGVSPVVAFSAGGGVVWSVAVESGAVGSLPGVCSVCVAVAAVISSACATASPAMARPA
jgi:hypothetical protein